MAGVVFDPVAVAHLLHHLEVVFGAHLDPLCLDVFAIRFEPGDALNHLIPNVSHGDLHLFLGRHELLRGEEGQMGEFAAGMAGEGIEKGDPVDLIAEELEAHRLLVVLGGKDFHNVTPDAEFSPAEFDFVPLVEHCDDGAKDLFTGDPLTALYAQHHLKEVFGRCEAVDAGDAGDHDHVAPGEQRAGGGEAETLDLLVDGAVLLDVGV